MEAVFPVDPRGILARMTATSRACRARGLWRTTRHTAKWAALHRLVSRIRLYEILLLTNFQVRLK